MRRQTPTEQAYRQYQERFNEFCDLMELDLTPAQRVFQARIAATKELTTFAVPVSTDTRRSCYHAYLRLVDAWFSYESLLILAGEIGWTSKSGGKPDRLLKSQVSNESVGVALGSFRTAISEIASTARYRTLLRQYLTNLKNYPHTSNTQSSHLYQFDALLSSSELTNLSYSTALGFAYAIRNAYAHNGETARAGMNHFKLKAMVLDATYQFVFGFVAEVASEIYAFLIDEIS